MTHEEILHRLDLIQATLQLAFAPELERAREALREDPIDAAILDSSEDWIGTTALQASVARKTRTSERTVRGHIAELASRGLLQVRGGGRPEYRRAGVV